MSAAVLGVPGVYDVQAHVDAMHRAAPRFTADGAYRICYTLPDGRDVLMSPSAGAVPIVRWLRCGVDYAVSRAAYVLSDLSEDEDELSQEAEEES
jgi:hypothetical protein